MIDCKPIFNRDFEKQLIDYIVIMMNMNNFMKIKMEVNIYLIL